QRAGPTTRSVLSRVAAAGGPVVVIGGWTGDDTVLTDVDTVRVYPLTEDQTRALVLGLVGGRSVDEDLVARVHTLTSGSPFYVTEVVADLRRRGALRREADGTTVVVGEVDHQLREVPTTVSHLVRRGLAALD